MKQKIYELLKIYSTQVNSLSLIEKYDRYHKIYKKLVFEVKQKKYNNVGFLHKLSDDIDYFAAMDDLIETNTNVFYSNIKKNKLRFHKLQSIYGEFEYYSGQRIYKNVVEVHPENMNVLVIPVQIFKDKKAVLLNKKVWKFVRNFKGIKIGIAYDFAKTSVNISDLNPIVLDEILTS